MMERLLLTSSVDLISSLTGNMYYSTLRVTFDKKQGRKLT